MALTLLILLTALKNVTSQTELNLSQAVLKKNMTSRLSGFCSGSSGSSGGCDASSGCDSYYLEILVSKPECEQPISRNKDDSFF